MTTIADLLIARAADDSPGLLFEDERYTYAEWVAAAAARADYLLTHRQPGPFHVGVLADNIPEFVFWLSGAALAGAVVVGINPTRRGAELERDITHTACQLIVTEQRQRHLLEGLDVGVPADRILVVDGDGYAEALAPHKGSSLPNVEIHESDLYLLLFTSGTTAAPKAVRCTQGRLASIGSTVVTNFGLGSDDVGYQSMPLFHSNALMAGWAPMLAAGMPVALRRRFSASGFMQDVRKFGATYANYVGQPLAYVLATPERPDDADNTLRVVFGNEGGNQAREQFAERFACTVIDGYGSTEGGIAVTRTPDTPRGALGVGPDGAMVADPSTGEECPRARFDDEGRLLNAEEAIGEIVNTSGTGGFEGYWSNEEATEERVRNGWYWTGDLGYRDEAGFFYFAGRSYDWMRVDGENFAAAPIERILIRHPDVVLAAVYGVPDPQAGDQVMATLQLREGSNFDPDEFATFLAAQPDLGTKWAPSFVRIAAEMPVTQTNKVVKRQLRAERWDCADPVWWRPRKQSDYHLLTEADRASIRNDFAANDRTNALDAV